MYFKNEKEGSKGGSPEGRVLKMLKNDLSCTTRFFLYLLTDFKIGMGTTRHMLDFSSLDLTWAKSHLQNFFIELEIFQNWCCAHMGAAYFLGCCSAELIGSRKSQNFKTTMTWGANDHSNYLSLLWWYFWLIFFSVCVLALYHKIPFAPIWVIMQKSRFNRFFDFDP